MDEQTKRNIFDPFFTTKDQGKGTGLGLSNVYGLMRQADGHIEVESKPGEGTTFDLYFPLSQNQPTKELSGTTDRWESIDFSGYTTLLAEDESDLLEIVADMLEKRGMTVIKAQNGNDALVQQDDYEGTIDLLLTDVVMPELNGVELAELTQALRPNIKVVFMSGYPANGNLSQINLPEQSVFMTKPVDYEQLTKLIFNVLSGNDNAVFAIRNSVDHWASIN